MYFWPLRLQFYCIFEVKTVLFLFNVSYQLLEILYIIGIITIAFISNYRKLEKKSEKKQIYVSKILSIGAETLSPQLWVFTGIF